METDAADSSPNPDHAHKIATILSIQPDDAQPLSQFSAEQRRAYEWAVRWLHDFNLGRMPKPGFSDEVLARLSDFHGTKMNEQFRGEAAAPPSGDQRPPGSSGDFIADMLYNLDTHEPYVPRGQNVRNCQQPEHTVAESLPKLASDQPEGMSPDDPLYDWTQRILAGMKRMTEDPEYRASIEKRIS